MTTVIGKRLILIVPTQRQLLNNYLYFYYYYYYFIIFFSSYGFTLAQEQKSTMVYNLSLYKSSEGYNYMTGYQIKL